MANVKYSVTVREEDDAILKLNAEANKTSVQQIVSEIIESYAAEHRAQEAVLREIAKNPDAAEDFDVLVGSRVERMMADVSRKINTIVAMLSDAEMVDPKQVQAVFDGLVQVNALLAERSKP